MSIEHRKDNHWRFRVRFEGRNYTQKYFSEKPPKMKDGKPIIPAEVEKAHNAFIVDVQRGMFGHNENMTFKDFCDLYINEYIMQQLAGASQYRKIGFINKHFIPYFNDIPLNKIKPIDIQQFFNAKQKEENCIHKGETLSARTLDCLFNDIRALFNKAVAWDIIKESPVKNINIPKYKKNNLTQILTTDELKRLILAIDDLPLSFNKLMLSIALYGGLRKGEILGLKVKDIDFSNNSININKQYAVKFENNVVTRDVKDTTKSSNSTRIVYLPQKVMNYIKDYIRLMKFTDNVFLMYNVIEKKIYSHNTANLFLTKFLIKNNLPKIRFHDLRHLNATMLINNGVNIAAIAKHLGDTVKTVSSVYVHDIEDVRKEAAKNLEKFVSSL